MYFYLMTRLYLRVQQRRVIQFVDHLNMPNGTAVESIVGDGDIDLQHGVNASVVELLMEQNMLMHHNYSVGVLERFAVGESRNASLREHTMTAWWQFVANLTFGWHGNTSLLVFVQQIQSLILLFLFLYTF